MSWNSKNQGDNYYRGPPPRDGPDRRGSRGRGSGGRFHNNNSNDRNNRYSHRPYYQRRQNDRNTYGHDGRLDTYGPPSGTGWHHNRHHTDHAPTGRRNHDDRRDRDLDGLRKKPKIEDAEEHNVDRQDRETSEARKKPKIEDTEEKAIIVNRDTWSEFSDRERFESQYPGSFRTYASIWELIENHDMIGFDHMLSNEWMEHKKEAAEIVIERYRDELKKSAENEALFSDSDSSEDVSLFVDGARPSGVSDNYATQLDPGFMKFMRALPYNVVFDVGFHMIGLHQKDEEACYCPCSKMQMVKWRTNFGVENVEKKVDKDECVNKIYTPKALMDHLSSIGTYLHRAIRDYLDVVYKEFWNCNTSHKALYNVGTLDYRRAEAELKKYFIRISELEKQKHRKEMEEKQRELEDIQKRNEDLEKLKSNNEELFAMADARIKEEDEAYEKFGITRGGELELSSEKRTAQYNELRDLLDSFRTAYQSYNETIEIELTHNMSLQDIFDSWYDLSKKKKKKTKSKTDNGGIFFRELDSDSDGANEIYKVFQVWNVVYSDVEHHLKTSKTNQKDKNRLTKAEIKEEEKQIKANRKYVKDLSAVDKGGPTRDLLNTFFCQLEDLVVYLPVRDDKMPLPSEQFGRDECEYMTPKIGWKVEEHNEKKIGRVLKYDPSTKKATIAFPDHEIEMHRERFKIIGIPIRLFEEDTCLPCRDHTFQVNRAKNDDESKSSGFKTFMEKMRKEGVKGKELLNRINKFRAKQAENLTLQITHESSRIDDQLWRLLSKYDGKVMRNKLEEEVGQMMRLFYRAFGRLILHVIFDGDNVLSPKVLSTFLRNVLLRGMSPHANEYDMKVLIDDIKSINQLELCSGALETKYNDFFQDIGMDFDQFVAGCNEKSSYQYHVKSDDLITRENFKSVFASLYLIETRREALDAILEGLTMNGSMKIHSFFHSKDHRVINNLLFARTSFSVEDVQELLEIEYEEGMQENYFNMGVVPNHVQFLDQLKKALGELSAENESVLSDFVYFMTGMEHLPNTHAHPEFRLKIGFTDADNDALPTGHTCHYLIDFPFMVYNNDFMVIKDKLSTVIGHARSAGFGLK